MIGKTRGRDGTGAYARFYWHMLMCGCYADIQAADGPTLTKAMTDLADRYPVDWTYVHLAQLNCRIGDAGGARAYLAMLTINQIGAWKAQEWDRCRALVGPSPEPFVSDTP